MDRKKQSKRQRSVTKGDSSRTTSAIQKEYQRNRRRIQSAIRRLERRGYLVPEGILPPRPKNITSASVRRLERITTDKLYKKSRYVEQETGEVLPGPQGRKVEDRLRSEYRREIAKQRAQERKEQKAREKSYAPERDYVDFDDTVIYNFQQNMTLIFSRNPAMLEYISNWLNRCLVTFDREQVADALERSKSNGDWPDWDCVSDWELLVGRLSRILDLMAVTPGQRQEVTDYLELMEDWNEPE